MKKSVYIFLCLTIFPVFSCREKREADKSILIPVKDEEGWGYIYNDGKMVITPQFGFADDFSEGLSRVMLKGKWGFIDISGKKVIEPQFDMVRSFCNGLSAVKIGEKWGFMDKEGKMVIQPQFFWAGNFSEGLAPVWFEGIGACGYIDKTGSTVINPLFLRSWPFKEGVALIEIGSIHHIGYRWSRWGIINKAGEIMMKLPKEGSPKWEGLLTPIYPEAEFSVFPFSEGLARIKFTRIKFKNKWGFIDKTGKFVAELKYGDAGDFSEGLARIQEKDKWGYIDKTGKIAIGLRFDEAGDFSEGLAKIRIDQKCEYINKTGETAIKLQFESDSLLLVGDFSEGLAYIVKGEKVSFIDKTGKLAFRRQLEFPADFSDGLALFIESKDKAKLADSSSYSDGLVKYVMNLSKNRIGLRPDRKVALAERITRLKSGSVREIPIIDAIKYGFINKKGKVVVKPRFHAYIEIDDETEMDIEKLRKLSSESLDEAGYKTLDKIVGEIEEDEILDEGEIKGELMRSMQAIRSPQALKLLKEVAPIYPEIARQARVEGVIILEVTTDIHGKVKKAKILTSIPLLDQAAIDAVKQWSYEPLIIKGEPKEAIFAVTVRFSLE